MVAVGFAYCLSGLVVSTDSWPFIAGVYLPALPCAILVLILLAFPGGRPGRGAERFLVVASYLTATLGYWAILPFQSTARQGPPDTPMLGSDDPRVVRAMTDIRFGVLAAVLAALAVILAQLRARVVVLATLPFAFLLGLLRSRVAEGPPARELVATFGERRELARGIHRAILSDRGPALEALAGRPALPVEVAVAVDRRLPASVEAAACFVASEALTDVPRYAQATHARIDAARYSQATHARIDAARRDGDVAVADDGVGGADPARGSRLRGLEDRVAALDGRLEVRSPPAGGTTVRATFPCAADGGAEAGAAGGRTASW